MTIASALKSAGERMIDADERVHEAFEPYADAPAMLAVDLFSKLGDQPQVRLISAGLLIGGIFLDDARLVRAGARMILAHEAATLAKDVVKTNVDRTRPRSAASREDKKPTKGRHSAKEMTSFPSGHSAGATAAARAFAREYPEQGPVALGAAALVAASQIPRRAHYPSDVAAGAAVGLAAEALTDLAWRQAKMDERSEDEG